MHRLRFDVLGHCVCLGLSGFTAAACCYLCNWVHKPSRQSLTMLGCFEQDAQVNVLRAFAGVAPGSPMSSRSRPRARAKASALEDVEKRLVDLEEEVWSGTMAAAAARGDDNPCTVAALRRLHEASQQRQQQQAAAQKRMNDLEEASQQRQQQQEAVQKRLNDLEEQQEEEKKHVRRLAKVVVQQKAKVEQNEDKLTAFDGALRQQKAASEEHMQALTAQLTEKQDALRKLQEDAQRGAALASECSKVQQEAVQKRLDDLQTQQEEEKKHARKVAKVVVQQKTKAEQLEERLVALEGALRQQKAAAEEQTKALATQLQEVQDALRKLQEDSQQGAEGRIKSPGASKPSAGPGEGRSRMARFRRKLAQLPPEQHPKKQARRAVRVAENERAWGPAEPSRL